MPAAQVGLGALDIGPRARRRLTTTRVRARGEDFRIVQLQGQLLVCSKANGNCCCGWQEKGRMPFSNDLWSSEWERRRIRNQLHLTFTGCLGPCAVGNSAVLLIHGRSIWLKDLNSADLVGRLFDYAEAMLASGQVEPPPPALREHIYERFVAAPDAPYEPLGPAIDDDGVGLERLDPVCLMDVDPVTARWKADHNGRTYYFCAPSCRRTFLADPTAYAVA